jgi:hypothetical protein
MKIIALKYSLRKMNAKKFAKKELRLDFGVLTRFSNRTNNLAKMYVYGSVVISE